MRIYLAGPMSGIKDFNYPAFNAEAARLRSLGHEVENPAENTPPPCGTWAGYMRGAIVRMLTCDCIATLPGYRDSRGARIEVDLAGRLSIPVMPATDFISGISFGSTVGHISENYQAHTWPELNPSINRTR